MVGHCLFMQFLIFTFKVCVILKWKNILSCGGFFQVEVAMQVFHHTVTQCRVSQCKKPGREVAAGFEGTFYPSVDLAIQVYVTLSNHVWMNLSMRFQGSMGHYTGVCLRTALWPFFELARCH